jgi:hypothetical protein
LWIADCELPMSLAIFNGQWAILNRFYPCDATPRCFIVRMLAAMFLESETHSSSIFDLRFSILGSRLLWLDSSIVPIPRLPLHRILIDFGPVADYHRAASCPISRGERNAMAASA